MASALVMVVDDEEAIRRTLAEVLQDEGYRVLLASNGSEAIELAEADSPDVVFLDIWMPGMDGIEALAGIREVSPSSRVIMVSGHATIQNALEATKRGAFDFIEKPLDIESVLLTLERSLESLRSRSDVRMPESTSTGVPNAFAIGERSSHLMGGEDTPILSHPGVLGQDLKGCNVGQRTLRKSRVLYGQGLHSGRKSGLVLEPLPKNSGIHFARIGRPCAVAAYIDNVDSTSFATTVGSGQDASSTIEHLMSALHAYRISNILVKCNGEIPIFDGSALSFCDLIEEAGIEEQGGEWYEVAPEHAIRFEQKVANSVESIVIEPSEKLSIEYCLNYPEPVGEQRYLFELDGVGSFKSQIAPARTFGFMRDIERLQRAGLAAGGRLDNFILIGSDGVVNTELRFEEELARHKILDCLGDIFLLGRPVRGKITAVMTGHSDNIGLLRTIRGLMTDPNYELALQGVAGV